MVGVVWSVEVGDGYDSGGGEGRGGNAPAGDAGDLGGSGVLLGEGRGERDDAAVAAPDFLATPECFLVGGGFAFAFDLDVELGGCAVELVGRSADLGAQVQ